MSAILLVCLKKEASHHGKPLKTIRQLIIHIPVRPLQGHQTTSHSKECLMVRK